MGQWNLVEDELQGFEESGLIDPDDDYPRQSSNDPDYLFWLESCYILKDRGHEVITDEL